MHNIDDGRFHKVANVIGQTMQFHPHGDAAINDALVGLGKRNYLLILKVIGEITELVTGQQLQDILKLGLQILQKKLHLIRM